jgi:hypothetical protein
MSWLLLIYTLPSEPSRKRAAVWRELKKAGAVYLRDGVCVLPTREDTTATFRAIAAKVTEFGGQATLVEDAHLGPERAAVITDQARIARAEEYAEIAREAERFLSHAQREREHRAFTFAELEEIEEDLGKLTHWVEQVRARDYFGTANVISVNELLGRCEAAIASFLEDAYGSDEEARS